MIVTFYSYKGGVGRSMALAAVAQLLCRRGLRVLAVDFDLEAPGLERYFFDEVRSLEQRRQPGLIDLVLDYKRALSDEAAFERAEFKQLSRYTAQAIISGGVRGGGVWLMTAGQRDPAEKLRAYAQSVRGFDWQDFFYNWKGDRFFEWLRRQWSRDDEGYDVVLVDSRTGVTEMGGVCAYQLADAAVLLCAPNHQNLEGTRDVLRDFRSAAVTALRQGRPLQLLAVPARLEADNPALEQFLIRFEETLKTDGLPAALADRNFGYRDLALYYHREMAVDEQGVSSAPESAIQAFSRLADALTLLAPAGSALGRLRGAVVRLGEARDDGPRMVADPTRSSAGFDVFLDAGSEDDAAALALKKELQARGLRVYLELERSELASSNLQASLERQLDYSAHLLVGFGRSSGSSWRAALIERARRSSTTTIVPVLWPDADVTALRSFGLGEVQVIDLRARPPAEMIDAWLMAVGQRASPGDAGGDAALEVPSPYPGGRAFSESESEVFFGRGPELAELEKALAGSPVVLLEGPAQVGKTSLVRAGLIPLVRRQSAAHDEVFSGQVTVVDFVSGVDRLAVSSVLQQARGPRAHLLVFDAVDAFDDQPKGDAPRLHGLAGLDVRRDLLQQAINAASSELRVLVVWRGVQPPLLDLVNERWARVALGPLEGDALRQAIEQPARQARHLLENGLAERLIESAQPARNAAFQVQLGLSALWPARRRGWLTNAALDSLGHLGGVYAAHAERALASLGTDREAAARVLMLALVRLDADGRLSLFAREWLELESVPALSEVGAVELRDRLVAFGLLDLWSDGGLPWVALARADPRRFLPELQEPEVQQFLEWRARLAALVSTWQATRRAPAALLQAPMVDEARRWFEQLHSELTESERSFLQASLERQRASVDLTGARAAATGPTLRVSVLHAYAGSVRQPIIVGHWHATTLGPAEAALDRVLGGALQRALGIDLYPASQGTAQVFINEFGNLLNPWQAPQPPAVIVVGLGDVGGLGAAGLAMTVRQGVLAWSVRQQDTAPRASPPAMALAAALVGSVDGALTIGEVAQQVVVGVRDANQSLARSGMPLVTELQLVEPYHDRAVEALRSLRTLSRYAPGQFEVTATISTGQGALRQPAPWQLRDAPHDLLVVSTRPGTPQGDQLDYGLKLRDSPVEQRGTTGGLRLADELFREASAAVGWHVGPRSAARTLAELLVPSELRPALSSAGALVLQLDRVAAAIPWEWLDLEPGGGSDKSSSDTGLRRPWAVRCAIVRRFDGRTWSKHTPRPDISAASQTVLVIGDPAQGGPGLATIPGARLEAGAVARAFETAAGLKADLLVGGSARDVLARLLGEPLRVLHLSGRVRTGLSGGLELSDGALLAAREVATMPAVPELVFVSAGHLGEPSDAQGADRESQSASGRSSEARGSRDTGRRKSGQRPELAVGQAKARTLAPVGAAALAEELLQLGVRCVVVSQRATQDAGCVAFASAFYGALLRGASFMDAVRTARSTAWEHHPDDDVWAAFAAWGDPSWRLVAANAAAEESAGSTDKSTGIASPLVLAQVLEGVAVRVQFHGADPVGEHRRLQRLETVYGTDWGLMGAVAEAFGVAYAAVGAFESALPWFARAATSADGSASMGALEQLGRLECRRAWQHLSDDGRPKDGHTASQSWGSLTEGSRRLEALAVLAPGAEHWAAAASGQQALSTAARHARNESTARDAARRMAEFSAKALAGGLEVEATEAALFGRAPLALRRLQAEAAAGLGRPDEGLIRQVEECLACWRDEAPDFWCHVGEVDLALVIALQDRRLAKAEGKLTRAYSALHGKVAVAAIWTPVYQVARWLLSGWRTPVTERRAADRLLTMLAGFALDIREEPHPSATSRI